jgi:hypothetical protein
MRRRSFFARIFIVGEWCLASNTEGRPHQFNRAASFQFCCPAKCGSRMKQSRLRCRDGNPECFGNFMQRVLPQVMQFDNILKSGSQLRDCVSQGCLLFGSCISAYPLSVASRTCAS